MPFWPRHVEEIMEDGKRRKSNVERQAIDEDILFLKSKKTDRIAFTLEKTSSLPKQKKAEKYDNKKEKIH